MHLIKSSVVASGLTVAFLSKMAFGQQVSPPTSAIADADLYVKIIGGIITGAAAFLGLPIIFLTYQKTRAEIRKLTLEAETLQQKLPSSSERINEEGQIRINVENSPNVHVQVLADPRFLAPLLLLLGLHIRLDSA